MLDTRRRSRDLLSRFGNKISAKLYALNYTSANNRDKKTFKIKKRCTIAFNFSFKLTQEGWPN